VRRTQQTEEAILDAKDSALLALVLHHRLKIRNRIDGSTGLEAGSANLPTLDKHPLVILILSED